MTPSWTPIPNARWQRMTYAERRQAIAQLKPSQQLAQARSRAAATGRDAAHILHLWCHNGYLSPEQLQDLKRRLEAGHAE